MLGLSFDVASASPINAAIKRRYGASATWGQGFLQNIFQAHPDQPNFIAIDLARTDDLEDTAGGSFGIGEYEDKWESIANSPKLAQWPKGGDRWTTLLEGVKVDGVTVPLNSTIRGVPRGSMLALLDTGDPTDIMPSWLRDAIYSKIPGAVPYTDKDGKVWIVPCNATASVSFQFG